MHSLPSLRSPGRAISRLPEPTATGSPTAAHGCTPLTPTESLFYRWLAEGFRPGEPEGTRPADIAIDALVCRQLVCGDCGRQGLDYRPMRRDRTRRILAACPVCHACEEV